MSDDKVKLPRSSYEELCKIIKAYGHVAESASLDEVSRLCAMNRTAISANNAFLVYIGVIEGGQSKAATARGKELAQALEHELPEQIEASWAHVVRETDFLGKMAAAVKIRGQMESSALEAHVAYSAGEAKSPPVMTGARAVVDILRTAGVVREQDGQLIASGSNLTSQDSSRTSASPSGGTHSTPSTLQLETRAVVAQAGGTSVRIELRIDAKPSELDGLGKKIRKLVQEIDGRSSEGSDT